MRLKPSVLWLVGAFAVPTLSAAFAYHYPIYSPALYEYIGHLIVDGKIPYRDVWDNKLPSVFYVDAVWQLLFGSNYLAHWVAELAVSLATIGLFAIFVRREGVTRWRAATFGFAVLLSLPGLRAFNYTEPYALLFILLALVAIQRGALIVSGIALAVATTFWIPSSAMLVAILAYQHGCAQRRTAPLRFLGAFIGSIVLYFASMLYAFNAPTIASLLRDMRSYEGQRWVPQTSFWFTLRSHCVGTLQETGLIVPFGALLGLLRIPPAPATRFALIWLACALAGAAVNLNFSNHYFVPSTAPLAYALAVLSERRRVSVGRQFLLGLLALAIILRAPKIADAMHGSVAERIQVARDGAVVGRILSASLPTNSLILVHAGDEGIYLRAQRDASGRFPNPAALTLTSGEQQLLRDQEYAADMSRADAIVKDATLLTARQDMVLRAGFVPVCLRVVPKYEIYMSRRLLSSGHRPQCAAA